MTHPLTQAAARRAAIITERLSCDHCGDDQDELRTYDNKGWTVDDILCPACFTGRDPEGSFTDHKLAQEAAK